MSRSKMHNPFCKRIGKSDKKDKRMANRKFRRLEKELLNRGMEPPANIREVFDTYDFKSDGLAIYMKLSDNLPKELIKELMRK